MLRNAKAWRKWEAAWLKSQPVNLSQNLRLVESLWAEARQLGVWPPADPMAGIEHCLRMARMVNGRKAD